MLSALSCPTVIVITSAEDSITQLMDVLVLRFVVSRSIRSVTGVTLEVVDLNHLMGTMSSTRSDVFGITKSAGAGRTPVFIHMASADIW